MIVTSGSHAILDMKYVAEIGITHMATRSESKTLDMVSSVNVTVTHQASVFLQVTI
jgi:hypothetical protein